MTTWEAASESELNELRLTIRKVKRAGGIPPVALDDLGGMTKRRAGQMLTILREMVKSEHAPRGARA